jgi:hypothetical protein
LVVSCSVSQWMVYVPRQPLKTYRVLVGISFREQRGEPGDVVELLPGEAEWMLADGVVEAVED